MLERVEHGHGLVTYQSRLLSACRVKHGFSTRAGGVSEGVYATLNLGPLKKGAGDPNMHVSENFRRLRAALGVERKMRLEARQVHGAGVHVDERAKVVRPDDAPEADAIVSADPRKLVVIRTADCVPVLMCSRDGRVVAGVHSGWRGFLAGTVGVIRACVIRLEEHFGLLPGDLCAAVGPAISVAHFEVGDEVASGFRSGGYGEFVSDDFGAKAHVDLMGAAVFSLEQAGLARERIDTTDRCTFEHVEEFFSYRRDRGLNGQMAAVITAACA
ncbi:MAG: peptidoglycan editing factor PgeF [Phycisphaeraceae bacterium]